MFGRSESKLKLIYESLLCDCDDPKTVTALNNCEIYGPGLTIEKESIGHVGKRLGKHLRLAHKIGVLDSRGRRVITIGGRNGLTPGSSIEKLQTFLRSYSCTHR